MSRKNAFTSNVHCSRGGPGGCRSGQLLESRWQGPATTMLDAQLTASVNRRPPPPVSNFLLGTVILGLLQSPGRGQGRGLGCVGKTGARTPNKPLGSYQLGVFILCWDRPQSLHPTTHLSSTWPLPHSMEHNCIRSAAWATWAQCWRPSLPFSATKSR